MLVARTLMSEGSSNLEVRYVILDYYLVLCCFHILIFCEGD